MLIQTEPTFKTCLKHVLNVSIISQGNLTVPKFFEWRVWFDATWATLVTFGYIIFIHTAKFFVKADVQTPAYITNSWRDLYIVKW